MNVSDKIINSELLKTPWNHKIIDNFLDDSIFNKLNQISSLLLNKYGSSDIHGGVYPITQLLDDLNEDLIKEIMSVNVNLLSNAKNILNSFPKFRKYESYYSIPSFTILKPNLGDFPIHHDKITKSLSIVIYLYPKISTGTKLYKLDSEASLDYTTTWKPNSALVFCGISNETWHTFGTTEYPRITLNFSLQHNIFKDIKVLNNEVTVKVLPDSKLKIIPNDKNIENFYHLGLISDDKIKV